MPQNWKKSDNNKLVREAPVLKINESVFIDQPTGAAGTSSSKNDEYTAVQQADASANVPYCINGF